MSLVTDYINNEAIFSFTSETAFTLPSYNSRNVITLKNLSAPALTLTAAGSELIDGNSTYVLGGNSTAKIVRGEAGWVVSEGSDSSITGALTVSNATESTSITTGSIITAGGVGMTKALWVGGLANVAGVVTAAATTEATVGGLGSLITAGGIYSAKKVITASTFENVTGAINYNLATQGAGTAYALTNTAAKVDLGTTDPVVVLDKAGTYLILAQVQLEYTGATVAAETASVKVRRTNNTAADVSSVVVVDLPVATTLTHTYGVVSIPPIVYTTALTNDSLEIFANVSAALGAGTIDASATGTKIQAVRLY